MSLPLGPVGKGLAAVASASGSSPDPLVPDLGTLALAMVFGGLFLLAGLKWLYRQLRQPTGADRPEAG